MLDLSDERWGQFKANYTDGATVARLLEKAYAGDPFDHWYEDLHQEICHQYTVSETAYLTAPHLIQLSKTNPPFCKPLLVLLGICHAYSDHSVLNTMPPDIKQAWRKSAQEAVPILLKVLAEPQPNPSDLLYLLSSLAACSGYSALARSMESLDYVAEDPD